MWTNICLSRFGNVMKIEIQMIIWRSKRFIPDGMCVNSNIWSIRVTVVIVIFQSIAYSPQHRKMLIANIFSICLFQQSLVDIRYPYLSMIVCRNRRLWVTDTVPQSYSIAKSYWWKSKNGHTDRSYYHQLYHSVFYYWISTTSSIFCTILFCSFISVYNLGNHFIFFGRKMFIDIVLITPNLNTFWM